MGVGGGSFFVGLWSLSCSCSCLLGVGEVGVGWGGGWGGGGLITHCRIASICEIFASLPFFCLVLFCDLEFIKVGLG